MFITVKKTNPEIRNNPKLLKYFDSRNSLPALLNIIIEPERETKYKTKPDIIGAAVLIQGYDAREGFGMTLIKNQAVERIPIIKKLILAGNLNPDNFSNTF
jgi:phosphoribosylanthranilate isomerase